MGASLGKIQSNVPVGTTGTFPASSDRSLLGKNANNSSDATLPVMGRNDLIRAWQGIILQFPLKQAAEEQDATRQAVEMQRNGDSAVSFLGAVNQARANPRVRAEIARLIGIPGHYGDPDFMEAWDRFMEFYARKQQQHVEGPAVACDDAMGDLFGSVH